MKVIKLTQGKFAIVDDSDYEKVSKIKWYFDHGYARNKGKNSSFYLHRYLLNLEPKDKIDHINGDGLDNRRDNLRVCSQSQNTKNSISHRDSLYSKFKGVSFHKALNYWTADICVDNRKIKKYAKSENEAAIIYNELATKYHGAFAKLNVIK